MVTSKKLGKIRKDKQVFFFLSKRKITVSCIKNNRVLNSGATTIVVAPL